jgi:CRP-like cAMP-binding protein
MTDFGVSALLDLLTDEEAEILFSLARRQAYADGETIHEQGDPSGGMSIVIAGQVKLVKRQPNGSQVLLATVNPGQNYGEVAGYPFIGRTHTSIAVGETVIDDISPTDFQTLLEHPGILRHLYDIAIYRLGHAVEMLDDMRALRMEARLAKLLLGMIGQKDTSSRIECLQEDLANVLGVSGMTLAKALAVLREAGLVTTGYRQILVPDVSRLRQWVAESQG